MLVSILWNNFGQLRIDLNPLNQNIFEILEKIKKGIPWKLYLGWKFLWSTTHTSLAQTISRVETSVLAISKTFLVENGAHAVLIFLKKIEFNFFTDIPWLIWSFMMLIKIPILRFYYIKDSCYCKLKSINKNFFLIFKPKSRFLIHFSKKSKNYFCN